MPNKITILPLNHNYKIILKALTFNNLKLFSFNDLVAKKLIISNVISIKGLVARSNSVIFVPNQTI